MPRFVYSNESCTRSGILYSRYNKSNPASPVKKMAPPTMAEILAAISNEAKKTNENIKKEATKTHELVNSIKNELDEKFSNLETSVSGLNTIIEANSNAIKLCQEEQITIGSRVEKLEQNEDNDDKKYNFIISALGYNPALMTPSKNIWAAKFGAKNFKH